MQRGEVASLTSPILQSLEFYGMASPGFCCCEVGFGREWKVEVTVLIWSYHGDGRGPDSERIAE